MPSVISQCVTYISENPIGFIALCLLVLQTTAAVMVTRYSKTRTLSSNGEAYNNSSLVVATEVVKFVSSLVLVFVFDTKVVSAAAGSRRATAGSSGMQQSKAEEGIADTPSEPPLPLRERFQLFISIVREENFSNISGTLKLAVPAALYTIQNNVIYTALNNLDATVFQVGYQSKVITTALLSVLLLNRSITPKKWLALFLLAFGIILTQLPTPAAPEGGGGDNGSSSSSPNMMIPTPTTIFAAATQKIQGGGAGESSNDQNNNNFLVGMVAVLVASMCSALAGVYFEKILKGTAPSVWVRNSQLAFFSIVIGMIGFLGSVEVDVDGGTTPITYPLHALRRFFTGYDWIVLSIILIQAIGGLIIACVVKYTDNILKGFATALSIVACGVLSSMYLGFVPSGLFLAGSAVVIGATMLYAIK